MGPNNSEQRIIEKIRSLPPDKAAEVEDFIDFLRQRGSDGELARGATRVSGGAFAKVWDNPDDADYDRL